MVGMVLVGGVVAGGMVVGWGGSGGRDCSVQVVVVGGVGGVGVGRWVGLIVARMRKVGIMPLPCPIFCRAASI